MLVWLVIMSYLLCYFLPVELEDESGEETGLNNDTNQEAKPQTWMSVKWKWDVFQD